LLGEGFIGEAAFQRDILEYTDLPDDTVYTFRTFLGKVKPRSIMVIPIVAQDQSAGVLVCASIYNYTQEDKDMMELIRHYLGVAVNNGANFEKTKRLTNELTFQNRLIQEQYEDMKNRLDGKTELLNSWLSYIHGPFSYALDSKGIVQIWSGQAERVHGISDKSAVGKSITRLYDESGWPSIDKAIQSAIQNKDHKERFIKRGSDGSQHMYEITLQCMSGENDEIAGIIITVEVSADIS
jgi:PAS domain S-box-containing protein